MVDKKNILITGSNGQLGNCLKEVAANLEYKFHFKEKNDFDITNYYIISDFLKKNKIDILINCAAYTDVNSAETNRIISNDINVNGVDNIAKLCSIFKIQLIHISTDYVFDGMKKNPYLEYDQTNPINFYGKTKLEGENCILKYNLPKSIIIRTSWLYSIYSNNFVNKIFRSVLEKSEIDVVEDEIGSPTNANDLAETIFHIIPKIDNSETEIYHFSNKGYCSRYQLALKINQIINGRVYVNGVKQNRNLIIRPKFSALNCDKISNDFNIKIIDWEKSLIKYLNKLKINLRNEI